MSTYREQFKNSKTYEESVTPLICGVLFVCALLIPGLIILANFHVINASQNLLYTTSFILIFSTIAPYLLYRGGISTRFIKYYVTLSVILSVAVIAVLPEMDVKLGYLLGIAVALIYLDTKLMLTASIASYIAMNVSLFIKAGRWMYSASGRMPSFNAVLVMYRTAVLPTTVEFLLLLPAFFVACYLAKQHLVTEEELFVELSTEEERYRLAFEGSQDVIFDYSFDTDALTYFGSILEEDADNTVERNINHAFEKLSAGELVCSEDIQPVIQLLNGTSDEPVSVRMCGKVPGEFIWIRIEGRLVQKGNRNIRVVGKITDITDEKENERDFLEVAKKDEATGFFTWEIGEQLINRLIEAGNDRLYFLFFKILNLAEITDQYGSFFTDAIISRIAETSRAVLKPDDYLFRLNNDTFIAIIIDTEEELLDMIHSSLEHSLDHIYTGNDGGGLDYIVRFIKDRKDLESIIKSESQAVVDPVKRSGNLDYDAVSFTFNILEHSKDFSKSMMLLLEHIANQFNIINIHIMERDDTPGLEICLYDFSSVPGGGRYSPGERRESDTTELAMTYDLLSNSEYIIINSSFLSNYGNDTRDRISSDHTSHFIVPILSAGEVYGTVDYEHLNIDYEWPEKTINTLLEVTRCMSTYLLRDRADSASRAKSDFLSSVSHEIRTPLNAISGFSELMLANERLDSELRRFATGIKGSADNLLAIISGILDFSKIESGKVEIMHERFRLSDLISDLYRMTMVSVQDKGIDYNISFEGNVPDGLIGDEQRIKQVLLNLVSNAIKFTNTGHIDVNISFMMDEGGRSGILSASIKDTGPGIKEDEIGLIFESFQYGDNARNKSTRGVGLGLTICRDLLHMMNGEISCESTYGEGSEFSITLPVEVFDDSPAVFEDGFTETRSEDIFHLPFICPRAKVLIVDDNKVNLDVAKGLIGQYHPQITTAMSGDEALNIYFSEHDFDVIFMDHMMPKMDGIECVNHLRKLNVEGAAEVPVVALTANAVKGARKLFLSSGMDDYISKPIKLTALAEVMTRWIPDRFKEEPVWDQSWRDPSKKEDEEGAVSSNGADGEAPARRELYDFSPLKEMNPDQAIMNVGGSKEVYRELLSTFLESDTMSEAQQYFDARDIENYRITVHGLKSSARYVGADKLSDKAKELEDLSKQGNWEKILVEHPVIIPMYRTVADSIRDYLEGSGGMQIQAGASESLTRDELMKILKDLKESLGNMDFDSAADICSTLAGKSYEDEALNTDMHDIVHMVESFDFEDAETNLAELMIKL